MIRALSLDPDALTREQWVSLTAGDPVPLPDVEPAAPLEVVTEPTGWWASANCRGLDPALFFPERGESTEPAKAVCTGCVVRDPCLAYALDNREQFGIWGGTAERERKRIRSARRRNSLATTAATAGPGAPAATPDGSQYPANRPGAATEGLAS